MDYVQFAKQRYQGSVQVIFFVLDDQPERCEGLKALLRQIDRAATFSEPKNWQQLTRCLQLGLPDLFVIDWKPNWLDIPNIQYLISRYPSLQIAVLTDITSAQDVDALLLAGILGIIPRNLSPHLILRTLELVLVGGHYVPASAFNPALLTHRFHTGARTSHSRAEYLKKNSPSRSRRGAERLSPRQHQIMRLVHMGSTNKTIARALHISEGTVKLHLSSIFRLLGATNRASAVALYNDWQFEKLQSLCSSASSAFTQPKAVHGMRSPVPLRAHKNLLSSPSLPINDSISIIAAQTSPIYGSSSPTYDSLTEIAGDSENSTDLEEGKKICAELIETSIEIENLSIPVELENDS